MSSARRRRHRARISSFVFACFGFDDMSLSFLGRFAAGSAFIFPPFGYLCNRFNRFNRPCIWGYMVCIGGVYGGIYGACLEVCLKVR